MDASTQSCRRCLRPDGHAYSIRIDPSSTYDKDSGRSVSAPTRFVDFDVSLVLCAECAETLCRRVLRDATRGSQQ